MNYVDWEDTAYVDVVANGSCHESGALACKPSNYPGKHGPRAEMGGTPAGFVYTHTCCDKSASVRVLISSGAPTSLFAGIYSAHTDGGRARFDHETDTIFGTMRGSFVAAASGSASAHAPEFLPAVGTVPGERVRSGTGGAPWAARVGAVPGEHGTGGSAFLLISIYSAPADPRNLQGDFDGDGFTDVFDISMLQDVIASGSNDRHFDLNQDEKVDADDLAHWLEFVALTVPGDTNFDRRVDLQDLAALNSYYGLAGAWSVGDFTRHADALGVVDTADLAILAANWGYDGNRSWQRLTVPEPALAWAIVPIGYAAMRKRVRGT